MNSPMQSDAVAVLIRAEVMKRRHGSSFTRRNGKTHSVRPPYLLSAHISLHSKPDFRLTPKSHSDQVLCDQTAVPGQDGFFLVTEEIWFSSFRPSRLPIRAGVIRYDLVAPYLFNPSSRPLKKPCLRIRSFTFRPIQMFIQPPGMFQLSSDGAVFLFLVTFLRLQRLANGQLWQGMCLPWANY